MSSRLNIWDASRGTIECIAYTDMAALTTSVPQPHSYDQDIKTHALEK